MPKLTFISKGGTIACNMGESGEPYQIAQMQGFSPADAIINLTQMAQNDGALYNSSKVGVNTLNVALSIEHDAEHYRLEAYKVFRPKNEIRVEYKTQALDVWVEGYVSRASLQHMDMKQALVVEIICPFPYWRSASQVKTEMNAVVKSFHFPFAITEDDPVPLGYMEALTNTVVVNNGSAATGFIMQMLASGNVTNPKVFNYHTGDFFGINYSLQLGDLVTVDSTAGAKKVTLTRGGVESNIFNYIMKDAVFLTLDVGDNVFTYEVGTGDAESLTVDFLHYDLYTGV